MKKYIVLGWLVLAACAPVLAQKKNEQEEKIAKRFDSTLLRLGRINPKQMEEVKRVAETPVSQQQLFDGQLAGVTNQAETVRRQIEVKKTSYIPRSSSKQQIDKDV